MDQLEPKCAANKHELKQMAVLMWMLVFCLCTDGGEEQAAAGEAGACRTKAPADDEESRDSARG